MSAFLKNVELNSTESYSHFFYPKHFLFTEDSSAKACFNHPTWAETPPGWEVLALTQSIPSLPKSAVSDLTVMPQSPWGQNTALSIPGRRKCRVEGYHTASLAHLFLR